MPSLPEPRFHHVQMNVVDPALTARFFAGAFPATQVTTLAGQVAVLTEDVFLRLNKVDEPAPFDWNTALWHIGWHSPDLAGDHARIAAGGATFFRAPPPTGHFLSPDNVDVEISRGPVARFDHVHLMSDAPLCAADWYVDVLGLRRGAEMGRTADGCNAPMEARREPANQIHGPSARLYARSILVFIYPNQNLVAFTPRPVERPMRLLSTEGHVLDHIGFTVGDVTVEEQRLLGLGVKILKEPAPFDGLGRRWMMIEGPDRIRIALVDEHD